MKIKSSIYSLQSPRSRSATCNSDERFRFLSARRGTSPARLFLVGLRVKGIRFGSFSPARLIHLWARLRFLNYTNSMDSTSVGKLREYGPKRKMRGTIGVVSREISKRTI